MGMRSRPDDTPFVLIMASRRRGRRFAASARRRRRKAGTKMTDSAVAGAHMVVIGTAAVDTITGRAAMIQLGIRRSITVNRLAMASIDNL